MEKPSNYRGIMPELVDFRPPQSKELDKKINANPHAPGAEQAKSLVALMTRRDSEASIDRLLRDRFELVAQSLHEHASTEIIDLRTIEEGREFLDDTTRLIGWRDENSNPYLAETGSPISLQKFRLLLLSSLPTGFIPLVSECFSFEYDAEEKNPISFELSRDLKPQQTLNNHDTIESPKILLIFNKESMEATSIINRAPEGRDPNQELFYHYSSPQKLLYHLGHFFANLMVDPTKATPYDYQASPEWAHFVGLALAAPRKAEETNADLYHHFIEQSRAFENSETAHHSFLEFFKKHHRGDERKFVPISDEHRQLIERSDLRSNQEMAEYEARKAEPIVYGFEKVVASINRGLRTNPVLGLFNIDLKITYELPTQPLRSYELDKDATEIKKYLEMTPRERYRELIDKSNEYRQTTNVETMAKVRHSMRRIIIASSQQGLWQEWQEVFYLQTVSENFRKYYGQIIDKEDYEDLTMIHQASQQSGRFGTGFMPYVAETKPGDYGAKKQVYRRRPIDSPLGNSETLARYRQEIAAKSDESIKKEAAASYGLVKDQREDWLDLKVILGSNSWQTPDGNLSQDLDLATIRSLQATLLALRIKQVPEDIVIRLKRLYANDSLADKNAKQTFDKELSANVRDALAHFGPELTSSPVEQINELSNAADYFKTGGKPEEVVDFYRNLETIQGKLRIMIDRKFSGTGNRQYINPILLGIISDQLINGVSVVSLLSPNEQNRIFERYMAAINPAADERQALAVEMPRIHNAVSLVFSALYRDTDGNELLGALHKLNRYQQTVMPPRLQVLGGAIESLGAEKLAVHANDSVEFEQVLAYPLVHWGHDANINRGVSAVYKRTIMGLDTRLTDIDFKLSETLNKTQQKIIAGISKYFRDQAAEKHRFYVNSIRNQMGSTFGVDAEAPNYEPALQELINKLNNSPVEVVIKHLDSDGVGDSIGLSSAIEHICRQIFTLYASQSNTPFESLKSEAQEKIKEVLVTELSGLRQAFKVKFEQMIEKKGLIEPERLKIQELITLLDKLKRADLDTITTNINALEEQALMLDIPSISQDIEALKQRVNSFDPNNRAQALIKIQQTIADRIREYQIANILAQPKKEVSKV